MDLNTGSTLERNLRALLSTNGTTSPYFYQDSPARTKIWPHRLPSDAPLPGLTYQIVDETEPSNLSSPSGFGRVRMQMNVYSRSYDEMKLATGAMRALLLTVRGTLVGVVNLNVQGIQLQVTNYAYEEETSLWKSETDFFIW